LVSFFTVEHKLEEATVKLVDSHNRLNAFTERLTKHGFGLHADTFDAINNDERTIGNTERSSHLRGEINVTRRVNQVDQVVVTVTLDILRESGEVFIRHLIEQRDTSGLDGNATILFILAGVRKTGIAGVFLGNDTRGGDERIRKRRLTL
jgi:hypothetical protein